MDGIMSVQLADILGRRTSVKIEVTGADAAAVVAAGASVVTALDAVSNLGVLSAQVALPIGVTPSVGVAGSNTDIGGKMRGASDVDGKTVVLRIPDPIASAVDTNGGLVKTDVALAAYLAAFETGGVAKLSDGEQVATWLYGTLDQR